MVDISGLDKAEVLLALYDGSRVQGLSFMGLPDSRVTIDDCKKAIQELINQKRHLYFDYWNGHVLKVDITNDEFDPRLYDRDLGEGAAYRAIDELRNSKKGG